MLELLQYKKLRPCEIINRPIFSNNTDMFEQLKILVEYGLIYKTFDSKETFYGLTFKGLLMTKLIALNEPRYCSGLKREIIEFELEPNGY